MVKTCYVSSELCKVKVCDYCTMFYRAVDAKQKLELALKTEEHDRHALATKLKKVLMIYTNIGCNI